MSRVDPLCPQFPNVFECMIPLSDDYSFVGGVVRSNDLHYHSPVVDQYRNLIYNFKKGLFKDIAWYLIHQSFTHNLLYTSTPSLLIWEAFSHAVIYIKLLCIDFVHIFPQLAVDTL